MFKRLVDSIRNSFYQDINIRASSDDSYLGKIITNIIPRIGEDIKITSTVYKIVDVRYNYEWERIGSVDILVTVQK